MISASDYQDIICLLDKAHIALQNTYNKLVSTDDVLISTVATKTAKSPLSLAISDLGASVLQELNNSDSAFLVALQNHVKRHYGSVANFITDNNIVVPQYVADLSTALGFTVPTDSVNNSCTVDYLGVYDSSGQILLRNCCNSYTFTFTNAGTLTGTYVFTKITAVMWEYSSGDTTGLLRIDGSDNWNLTLSNLSDDFEFTCSANLHDCPPSSNADWILSDFSPGLAAATIAVDNCYETLTWEDAPFGRACYWVDDSEYLGATISQSTIIDIADLAYNGGTRRANDQLTVRPNSLLILDCEQLSRQQGEEYWVERINWAKEAQPSIKVGLHGVPVDFQGLDLDAILTNPNARDILRAGWDRLDYAACDFINYDVYLLGPTTVDRDINARIILAETCRDVYPTKPIIPFVWGAYDPSYEFLSMDVVTQYATHLKDTYEAVAVWGDYTSNALLISALLDIVTVRRAAKGTWASSSDGVV